MYLVFIIYVFVVFLQKSLKINSNSKLIAQLRAKTVWFALLTDYKYDYDAHYSLFATLYFTF